ncbi:MAG: UDP-N-acetylmuramate dehydrogenase [Chloroflexota bacterium]
MTPEVGVRLAPFTSLRVGGEADFFVLAQSGQDLADGLRWAADRGLPVRVIGGGSNLLVAEAGVEGLVIKTANAGWSVEYRRGEPILQAQAGANLARVARRLAKQGLGGLEWAANVPGTVGGAVVNNAGAFGSDTAACLLTVTLLDATGHRARLSSDELGYVYRASVLKRREREDLAVEQAEFRLSVSTPDVADGMVKQFNAQRMRSQPRILSAGSVFANPEGSFAGRLIEQAGLKRACVGAAQVSEQHANFIVNLGGATARDVFALMRQAQDGVYARSGVWLSPEIELLGRWSPAEQQALRAQAVLSRG